MSEVGKIDLEDAIAVQRSSFLDGRVTLYGGDCVAVLARLPENSVDSVVCDPPYHLTSIVKRFSQTNLDGDGTNEKRAKAGSDAMARLSKGFMGKAWDGGDIAFRPETWALVLRVLKPGGHLIAFSGTRTYHRMACAIEDAGFEVRDMIAWHYGSGFPKSHNVSKAMDARSKLGSARTEDMRRLSMGEDYVPSGRGRKNYDNGGGSQMNGATNYTPEGDVAKQWDGWGTALKPATEPMCLARKPLDGTVAENVMKWGTGALNIDACRVPTDEIAEIGKPSWGGPMKSLSGAPGQEGKLVPRSEPHNMGRWPANLMLDGSPEVVAMFPDSDGQQAAVGPQHGAKGSVNVYGDYGPRDLTEPRGDGGSAARFFWSSKAAADDRLGSKHPTVKPIDLMQELVRLVTPKGGTVLDPFAGTGTTGEAAWREGMRAILIEREEEYQADIARRMELAANPTKRAAVAKTKNKLDRPDDLPLFRNGEPLT